MLETPSLWTIVTIKMWKDTSDAERIARLQAHLAMGENRPLDVIVTGNTPQRETQDLIFGTHGHRIRSLTFPSNEKNRPSKLVTESFPFPNLRVVHVASINTGLWGAPKLVAPNLKFLFQSTGRVKYGAIDEIEQVPDLKVLDLRDPIGCNVGGQIEFKNLIKISNTLEELSFAPRSNKGQDYVRVVPAQGESTDEGPYFMHALRLLRLSHGLTREAVQFLLKVKMPQLFRLCIVEAQRNNYTKMKLKSLSAVRVLEWTQQRVKWLQDALLPVLQAATNIEEITFLRPDADERPDPLEEEGKLDDELQLLLVHHDRCGLAYVPNLKVLRITEASISAVAKLLEIRPSLKKVYVQRLHVENNSQLEEFKPIFSDRVEFVHP